MRTAIVWEGLAEPMQVVWRDATLIVENVVLDAADGDVAEQLRRRFDPRGFRLDLRRAPMMRGFRAHDPASDRWLLLILFHHMVSDHTTLEGVVEEAHAHLLGEAGRLLAPLAFRDFVAQARLGVAREEHEAFFRSMLGDVSEPTAPFGLLDARGDGSGVDEARLALDASLARRLREQARALGVSAASLCHQAFAQVLARASGRDDVVFGTVLFGRMHGGAGVDRALGVFINTLPLRVRLGAEGVAEAVRRTHALLTELLRHEHASLALAQRCSDVVAPTPLFSALLNYRHSPAREERSEERSRAWEGIEPLFGEERTNYPLTLSVDDLDDGLLLTAQTQSPLDPERICAYMNVALESLVEALEHSPQTLARTIDILPQDERHRLLVEWNDTATRLSTRQAHARAVRGAGGAGAGGRRSGLRRRRALLWRAERESQSAGASSAIARRRSGCDRRPLRRALLRDDRRSARRAEGRWGLSAHRSGLSQRPHRLHDRGRRADAGPHPGPFARAPATRRSRRFGSTPIGRRSPKNARRTPPRAERRKTSPMSSTHPARRENQKASA